MRFDLSLQSDAIPRSDLSQDAEMLQPLNLGNWRVFDALQTVLPGTAASDDLGIVGGTHGTNFPFISTGDVKAAGCTRKARFVTSIRAEFVREGSLFIRARAGMVTTVADVSATIDFSVFKAGGAVVSGSDLVTTAAISINSLDWDDYDFAFNSAGLIESDELDILATIVVADSATATAVIAGFRAFLGCTIRG